MTLLSELQVTWNQVQGLTSVGSQLCSTLLVSVKACRRAFSASPDKPQPTSVPLVEKKTNSKMDEDKPTTWNQIIQAPMKLNFSSLLNLITEITRHPIKLGLCEQHLAPKPGLRN